MNSIVCEGKTSNEAIEKGLKELNCKLEDVNVRVLEEENKKAFFSILAPRVVKVELTLKENTIRKIAENRKVILPSSNEINKCKENIETFLKEFAKVYGNIDYNIIEKDNSLFIEIVGDNSSKLIGYRGDTINALQTILSSIGNKNTEKRVRVSVDIANYREKREQSLKELASKLEKTVIRTGKKIVLEPMTAFERKIIHSALQESTKVTTYSIGEEPHRKIVVDKKRK